MQSKPSNGGLNEKRSKIPLSKRLKPILGVILLSNTLLVSGVQSALSKTANQKYDNCTLATELIDKSHSSKDYRQYLLTAIDLIGQKSPTLLGLAYFTLSKRMIDEARYAPDSIDDSALASAIDYLTKAEKLMNTANASQSDSISIKLARLDAEIVSRNYKKAKLLFSKLTQTSNLSPEQRVELGYLGALCHYHLYDFKAAEKVGYEALESINTNDSASCSENKLLLLHTLGLIACARGEFDKAIEYFDKALSKSTTALTAVILTDKAICSYRKGDFKTAKKILESQIEAHPKNKESKFTSSRARTAYAVLLCKLGKYAKSEVHLSDKSIQRIRDTQVPVPTESLHRLLDFDSATKEEPEILFSTDPQVVSTRSKTNASTVIICQEPAFHRQFLSLYDSVLKIDPLLEAEALRAKAENHYWLADKTLSIFDCFHQRDTFTLHGDDAFEEPDQGPIVEEYPNHFELYMLESILLQSSFEFCATEKPPSDTDYIDRLLMANQLCSFHKVASACLKEQGDKLRMLDEIIENNRLNQKAQIRLLRGLNSYKRKDFQQARKFCLESFDYINLAKEPSVQKLAIQALMCAIASDIELGNFIRAESSLEAQLDLIDKAKASDRATIYEILTYLYQQNRHLDKLATFAEKALQCPQIDEQVIKSFILENYLYQKQYKKAIALSDEILRPFEKKAQERMETLQEDIRQEWNPVKCLSDEDKRKTRYIYLERTIAFENLGDKENSLKNLKAHLEAATSNIYNQRSRYLGIEEAVCLRNHPEFDISPSLKNLTNVLRVHTSNRYFGKGKTVKVLIKLGEYKDTACGSDLKEVTKNCLNSWNAALVDRLKFELTDDQEKADLFINFGDTSQEAYTAGQTIWYYKHNQFKSLDKAHELFVNVDVSDGFYESYSRRANEPEIVPPGMVIDYSSQQLFYPEESRRKLSVYERAKVKSTVLHELGHVLGLAHSPYTGDIMFPINTTNHELSKRDIGIGRKLLNTKLKR